MRPQSKVNIIIRNKILGGKKPLICIPVIGKDKITLNTQLINATEKADVIEWRADGYDILNKGELKVLLQDIRDRIRDIPLIFTLRNIQEGGQTEYTLQKTEDLYFAAIESGLVDIIDTELARDNKFIKKLINLCRKNNVKMILSHHNFNLTPDEDIIIDKLIEAKKVGADICKVAYMPTNHKDVLNLMNATLKAREAIQSPLITISMGDIGKVTRIAGGVFGSDMTFASLDVSSAPGQVPIEKVKTVFDILY